MNLDRDQQRRQRAEQLDPEDRALRAKNQAAAARLQQALPEFTWSEYAAEPCPLPAQLDHYRIDSALNFQSFQATDLQTSHSVEIFTYALTDQLRYEKTWQQIIEDQSFQLFPQIIIPTALGRTVAFKYAAIPVFQGETLSQRLQRETFTERQSAALIRDCARLLTPLHDRGLRHDALHEDHLLFTEQGLVLKGFPQLQIPPLIPPHRDPWESGPHYSVAYWPARRSWRPHNAPNEDLGQLAYLLALLVTGEHPFGSPTDRRRVMIQAPLRSDYRVSPPAHEALDRIIHKANTREKASTYATAEELAQDLDRFLNNEEVLAAPIPEPEQPRSSLWNRLRDLFGGSP